MTNQKLFLYAVGALAAGAASVYAYKKWFSAPPTPPATAESSNDSGTRYVSSGQLKFNAMGNPLQALVKQSNWEQTPEGLKRKPHVITNIKKPPHVTTNIFAGGGTTVWRSR